MSDLDALGGAGGAGGEEDVGEPVAARCDRLSGGLAGQRLDVEALDLGGEVGGGRGVGQDQPGGGQLEQLPLALRRVAGADRDVGGARPHRPEEGADRLPGARQADADDILLADPRGAQSGGDAGAGGIELGIREAPLAVFDRYRVGALGGVPGYQLHDRSMRLQSGRC